MSLKKEQRAFEEVAVIVGDLLRRAVSATITDRVPDRAREAVGEFLDIDDRAAAVDAGGGPTELLATLTLVRWHSLAREALADRPRRVEEVLTWIEDNIGRRYRARARYTSAIMVSEEGAQEIVVYRSALEEEFLATLIWLFAGAVALYGDGDLAWLDALEAGRPPVTSGLS
jgi:hypothetical protein